MTPPFAASLVQVLKQFLGTMMIVGVLAGCSPGLPSFARPHVSKEAVEADVKARLGHSQVRVFTLEKQTVQWVEQNMSSQMGAPMSFSNIDPNRVFWVAYLEGNLAKDAWPGQESNSSISGFSKILMLIELDGSGPSIFKGIPVP